ncbi:cysteine synthase A [Nesterenkonia alkaliphila]|uniref:Cysteine synthase n=1 Tax=Nesterenkonia alkaliphila TaxID=1463631 RepID=A0A7K1UMN1_9MICC|nr:cysteine synthase A [Nesterenkonia alkaliphila]MVT27552.1 cysteine synthase A [Nesterenkonia alkaliphila]GFZ80174.1 cysteine synthase [Nesterenkonia alkaliphila]
MPLLNNITEAIGNTPLVKLNKLDADLPGNVAVKLEFYSPASSVKDRIGAAIIDAAEAAGVLKPGGTIVEGTSGNTGIALAMVGAARGYRVVLTMPETMSTERRVMLRAYGAEIVLTSGAEGMRGAVEKAKQIVEETENAIWARQFANEANPTVHYNTTGEEIWRDTDGAVDVLVSGIGTGGTITGAGRKLREHNPDLHLVAVEPEDSPILSGGAAGPHKIQGIGPNFVPEVLDTELYNEVVQANLEEAITTARRLGTEEGILGGISTGAMVASALKVAAREEMQDKLIVTIAADFGERYISTLLYEDIRG